MKQTLVAAAALAVGATAQNSTSTYIHYYNTCSTTGIVTAPTTVTWCPPCEAASMTSFPGASITVYTTTFKQVCPTDAARLEDATYTVTEPCPSTGLARGPSYLPQGFTVTTVSCSACEAGKSQYAQTTPGPALASYLATPAAAPATPTPAPAPAAAPAGGAGGAPAAAPAPGAGGAPAAAPAPGAGGAPAAAPAPGAGGAPAASGSGGAASPANAENGAAAPGAPAAPGAASPANAENAAVAPGTPPPAGSGASSSPAENGAAAPAGAPAPYPLPSQAGQVAIASGAPLSNSTIPFTGAANIVSVGILSFITALATLISGFAFVL